MNEDECRCGLKYIPVGLQIECMFCEDARKKRELEEILAREAELKKREKSKQAIRSWKKRHAKERKVENA